MEVGDYTCISTIGKGYSAKVKRAKSKSNPNGPPVAIKIFKKRRWLDEPQLQSEVRREIALMHLVDHPHLIKLITQYESEHHLYLVLECARGEIFDCLHVGALAPDVAISFFREIIFALDYLHSHGICHRDHKPENILLDEFDHVKIADFGFACLMRKAITGSSYGTLKYAAPEVLSGQSSDGRAADVWSCGVILFAMLARRLPFSPPTIGQLRAMISAGEYVMPDAFSGEIRDLVANILVVDPAERITIDAIKAHPAFRMGLPPNYELPRPICPLTGGPIDPVEAPVGLLQSLLAIGYSQREIDRELLSEGRTTAKVFYEMYRERIAGRPSLGSLPWAKPNAALGAGLAVSVTPLVRSPCVYGDDGPVPDGEVFDRRDYYGGSASPDYFSAAAEIPAGAALPPLDVDHFTLLAIAAPLPDLMELVRAFLTHNGFERLHPTDVQFLARQVALNLVVVIGVRFVRGAGRQVLIELTLTKTTGGSDAFTRFADALIGYVREAHVGYPE
jgi:BR serine/threonine kinase